MFHPRTHRVWWCWRRDESRGGRRDGRERYGGLVVDHKLELSRVHVQSEAVARWSDHPRRSILCRWQRDHVPLAAARDGSFPSVSGDDYFSSEDFQVYGIESQEVVKENRWWCNEGSDAFSTHGIEQLRIGQFLQFQRDEKAIEVCSVRDPEGAREQSVRRASQQPQQE